MEKNIFNIFAFILYIVGLLFLICAITYTISNIVYVQLIASAANISIDYNVIRTVLIVAAFIYILFSLPAGYAYSNPSFEETNSTPWLIAGPLFGIFYCINFCKKAK